MVTLESVWIEVDGVRMHARVSAGASVSHRPAIVLVHGLGVSSRYLLPTAELLVPDYRVYAPDMPGFGKSEKPAHVLNVRELADALHRWMRQLQLPPAVLVGNSLGCQVIVDLVVRIPECASRIVLQGPTVDPGARNWHQHVFRAALDGWREPVSLWWIIVHDYLTAGLERDRRMFQHALRDRIEEKLPLVKCPGLVVRGERDPIVPQHWAEQAARLLPGGRLVVVPGATHAVNYSAPQQFANILRGFIEQPAIAHQDSGLSS